MTIAASYDNLTNAKGKLKKVTSSVSTTEYTSFDILGRVTGHKQTTEAGLTAGAVVAGGAVAGGGSAVSVVPEVPQLSRGASMVTDLVGGPSRATGTVNPAGDLVITGKEFKFRVDFKNPGNDAPHMHLEQFRNDRWRDAVPGTHRIYPEP